MARCSRKPSWVARTASCPMYLIWGRRFLWWARVFQLVRRWASSICGILRLRLLMRSGSCCRRRTVEIEFLNRIGLGSGKLASDYTPWDFFALFRAPPNHTPKLHGLLALGARERAVAWVYFCA